MRLSGYRDKANRAPNIQPWHEAERLGSATTSTAMRGYSRRGNERGKMTPKWPRRCNAAIARALCARTSG